MGLENEYDQTGHINSDFEAYKSIVLKCRDKTDDELRKDHQARLDKEEERCQQIRKNRDQAWIMQYKQEAEPIKTKLLHNGFGIERCSIYMYVSGKEMQLRRKVVNGIQENAGGISTALLILRVCLISGFLDTDMARMTIYKKIVKIKNI